MSAPLVTVRDLRRRWRPTKERLSAASANHPTCIRLHRSFSWMERAERVLDEADADIALLARWIAFNALYGQWDEERREPEPDRVSWQRFYGRLVRIDKSDHLGTMLTRERELALSVLEDRYLNRYFWSDPQKGSAARQSQQLRQDAAGWFRQRNWSPVLDRLLDRIYLLRCQLAHGAATFGGKLNRESLQRCNQMLAHLLVAILMVMIDHGGEESWGVMCYPPVSPGPAGERPTAPRREPA